MRGIRVLACVLAVLVLAPPVESGAGTTAAWRAEIGYRAANGTVALTLLTTGKGSALLNLKGMARSRPVIVTLRSGRCYAQGPVLGTLAAGKSTTSGKLRKTLAVTSTTMGRVVASTARIAVVKSGSASVCADLAIVQTAPPGGFATGTKLVGTDVKPGTYRTRIPSAGCYWERLSGLGGTLGEIVSNDNTDAYAVVTIAPTDSAFSSERCAPWSPDLSAVTANDTTFGEGTYIVGTDVRPGRYRSTGTALTCYWERLSGFSGTTDDIVANDNVDGPAVVDIAVGDAGFSSSRCGTWTIVSVASPSPSPMPSATPTAEASSPVMQVGQKVMVGGKGYITVASVTPGVDSSGGTTVAVRVVVQALVADQTIRARDFALVPPDGRLRRDLGDWWSVELTPSVPIEVILTFSAPVTGPLDLDYSGDFGFVSLHIRN